MIFWEAVTAFGDSAVLVPVAVLIGFWLFDAGCYGLARKWCLTVAAVGLAVALSKLMFMGWCVGLRRLDFTGISGHTAMSAAILPVLLHLLQQAFFDRRSASAWKAGAVLALLVGVSRVAVEAHSVSEVIAGLIVGLSCARVFLQAATGGARIPINRQWILLSVLVLPGLLWLQPAPTQYILQRMAMLVSGQRAAFTRQAENCELPQRQIGQWPASGQVRGHGLPAATAEDRNGS